MAAKITLGVPGVVGQPTPPFDGLDEGKDLIYVYGVISLSGSYPAATVLTLTAAANASGGNTVYNGTITGGANNGLLGYIITVAGFTNAGNNGTFICVASTATTITLNNASGVSETHAATGTEASGDILDFTTVQPLIATNYTPIQVTLQSQNTGGASGYVFLWRPGTTLRNGRLQIFTTGASSGAALIEYTAGSSYNSFLTNDVIVFVAAFVRGV